MMPVLQKLLAVRRLRDDIAMRTLGRMRGDFMQAEACLEIAQRQSHDWKLHAHRQEAGWYADLCSRVVGQHDIDDMLAKVAVLKQQTAAREDAVEQARKRLANAAGALREARARRGNTYRALTKTDHLVQAGALQQRHELDRREEDDQDETAGARHGLRIC